MSIRRAVAAAAMATVLVAGCGTGDGGAAPEPTPGPTDNGVSAMPGNAILARTKVALENANSYRITGHVPVDKQKMELDLKIKGDDVGGFLKYDGARVDLLAVGGQRYIRPDEAFWVQTFGAEAAENMAKLMGDKWAKVPEDEKGFDEIFQVTRIETLLDNSGTMTKGTPTEVNGVAAVPLTEEGGDGSALYVATTGEPYPVLIESADPADGRIAFSEFGAPFAEVAAPPEAQVIDFGTLRPN
jgi:hypothetical protein